MSGSIRARAVPPTMRDREVDDADDGDQDHYATPSQPQLHLHILPPIFFPESLRRLLEHTAACLEVGSSVVEVIQLAVPLQHLVNVVPHHPHHLVHL